MEDYDTFVQLRLSHLRKREQEEEKPSPSSSLIRFYGRPVLPPLLSEEQREEMQRHRHAAQEAAVHKKVKDDPRMTYVQTILHSVQLRKTPTLEELLQESEIYAPSCSRQNNDGSGSQSGHFQGTKDDVLLSSPPNRNEKEDVSLPPFTSTAYSAFLSTDVTPQEEGRLKDPHYSQNGSQPSSFNGVSHLSSGYMTYKNVENTTGVSVGFDSERQSDGFVVSEGADSMNGFFLHNTSNTISKMPDIISYPPIDGEELERSGLESSFCKDFEDVQDICGTTLQEDSVMWENSEGEKSESCLEDSTEGDANVAVATSLDLDKGQTSDRVEGQVSVSQHGGFSDNPESSHTSPPPLCPTTEEHLKDVHTEIEAADIRGDEEQSSEEPYRLSLQALLKKSQEYRRRQRMLRNQAKNSKIKERTQEQPKTRAEEPSLSDKENDEFAHKASVTAEGKKTKEGRSNIIQSAETSPKKSWDSDRSIQSELFEEKTNFNIVSTTLTGDENIKEITGGQEETTLRNNKLNTSPELITEPKEFSRQQQVSPETSPVQEAFSSTPSPPDSHRGGGKYKSVPAPHFCRSPVRCKSSVQDKRAVNESFKGLLSDVSAEELNPGPENFPTTVSSNVSGTDEGDSAGVSSRSSQHIEQLESNLSGLKVLISDLESTLTESFRNQSLSESKQTRSHDDDGERNQNELLRRRSSNGPKSAHEDSGSDPSIRHMDDGPVTEQGPGTEEVNLSELRLVKTLVTERGLEKRSGNDRLTKSHRAHGGAPQQLPAAKRLLSVAQHLRVPNIFRNVASDAAAPSDQVSVLSDSSNHPVDRRTHSTCSPSLNQSYDVHAPSGLWLREGSASDCGTRGEKHLTPESEGEGQSGVSKVKRRLLMHMTEDTQERSASGVRPNSSTPRAATCWSEDDKSLNDRQEQLKQAHAAQVRALQEQHRRQQEELLQALAERFRLLQSVSFPCSMSSSRLGDTLTFTSISQPSSTLSERCRPLLLAAVKGFLTRRLLGTEKVSQLARTVRDTQQLLQALRQQQQSPGRGEFSSRQDLLLQERVALQLRAARYEVNDIFFRLSAGERMQLISWDRELSRERELRRQSHPRGRSSLSAATQKSLERKKEMMMQKKAAARNRRVLTKTEHTAESSAEQPLEKKRGQFRANPQRVPKSTYSSRPL